MQISYRGQLTWNDCLRACMTHYRPSPAAIALRAVPALVSVAAILCLESIGRSAAMFWPIAVASAGLLLAPWGMASLAARRVWMRDHAFRAPQLGTITEQGLQPHAITSGIAWSDYASYRESRGMALLYASPSAFSAMSRSFFASDTDWESFLALVRASVIEDKGDGREQVWIPVTLIITLALVAAIASSLS